METSQITLTETPELHVHPQSFLVFNLETAASSHKNTMFWNCIDMFLAQKKNKLQMQPIRKLELLFVSAGLKTLRGKPKQQIKLIHGKMRSVRTGTQIPILKLAGAHEGITYPLKFLGCSHQVPWDDTAGDVILRIASKASPFLKQATSGPFFVKQHHQGTASPALFMPALPSLLCSPLYNPSPFQLKLWSNGSR